MAAKNKDYPRKRGHLLEKGNKLFIQLLYFYPLLCFKKTSYFYKN
jgi:hypothetical protein